VFHQEMLKSRTKSTCLFLPTRNNFLTPDTQKEHCFAFWAVIGNVMHGRQVSLECLRNDLEGKSAPCCCFVDLPQNFYKIPFNRFV